MTIKLPVHNICFDLESGIVIMQWNGYATSEEFRSGTELMLKELVSHGASKVLADVEDMINISTQDQQWLEKNFLPRAIHAGFKICAMVKPKNYFNKVAVETVSYKMDRDKLQISFFDTREEAKAWLQSLG